MKTNRITLTFLACTALTANLLGQSRLIKSADVADETALTTTINVDYGSLKLKAGDPSKLFSVNALYDSDAMDPDLVFKRGKATAKLVFSTNSSGINMSNRKSDENGDFQSTMQLSPSVGHDLQISIGAGESDIDLSGLTVTSLDLSNGAGSCKLTSTTPNPETIRHITIQSGVGEVEAKGLSNLNFRKLTVNNGIGQITLDFSGKAEGHKAVTIETGVGEIKVLIPAGVGVMVRDDSGFFSNLSVPKNYTQEEETYYSPNYETAKATIEFDVSTGIGEIRFVTLRER